mgnify:CR=1 FL=1
MTIVAGCDVGSLTSKAVIMTYGRILGSAIIKSRPKPKESAEIVMRAALNTAGLRMDDIAHCTGTGYGREKISFVRDIKSEISCHGKTQAGNYIMHRGGNLLQVDHVRLGEYGTASRDLGSAIGREDQASDPIVPPTIDHCRGRRIAQAPDNHLFQ